MSKKNGGKGKKQMDAKQTDVPGLSTDDLEERRKLFEQQQKKFVKEEKKVVRTKDFNTYNPIRNTKRASAVLEEHVFDKPQEELKDTFILFDSNGDGRMPVADFCKVLRALRHDASKQEMEMLMSQGKEIDFCHAVQFYKMIIDREEDEQILPSSEAAESLILERKEREAQEAAERVALEEAKQEK